MSDSPFFSVPSIPHLGPTLFVAPSNVGPNNAAPFYQTLVPLLSFAQDLGQAIMRLQDVLNGDVVAATKDLAGAVSAARAIDGIAQALEDNLAQRPQLAQSVVAKCHALRGKADALLSATTKAAGPDLDPRKVVPGLDAAVKDAATKLVNLLHDSTRMGQIKTFAEDESVPKPVRAMEMIALGTFQSYAIELLARTDRIAEITQMAEDIFLHHDVDSTVPALTIQEGKTLWDAFVQATLVVTGSVGNLPAPDSLSLALLKCYGAFRLPEAALKASVAKGLEGDMFAFITDAVKLSDGQKSELRDLMDDLHKAQKEVIRSAKAERDTAERLPGHDARIARKSRQRLRAEETCEQKATAAKDFMRETYGPKNEELYMEFQRGPFVDSFISVLCIVQFYAALGELDDPKVSDAQKLADISTSGLLSLGAVVATIGKLVPRVDLGIAKLNLAALGKIAEGMASKIAVFAGAMAIVSGSVQCYIGWVEGDPKAMVIGGLTAVSGACIVVGAIASGALGSSAAALIGVAAGAVFTGIGVAIGVLLAAYAVFDFLSDALKSSTEKAIDGLLDGLKSKTTYNGQKVVAVLGIAGAIEEVHGALSGWSPFLLLPAAKGSPTHDELVERMNLLGFKPESSKEMIDEPSTSDDPPPYMVPPLGT